MNDVQLARFNYFVSSSGRVGAVFVENTGNEYASGFEPVEDDVFGVFSATEAPANEVTRSGPPVRRVQAAIPARSDSARAETRKVVT